MTRALVILLVLAPALARAESKADALRAQGIKAAGQKDWETARKRFAESYALDPQAETLFDLATAQDRTDQLVEARASYQKFVAHPRADARFRKRASEALHKLEGEIPTLKIRATGFSPPIAIALDDKQLSEDDLSTPIVLDPGEHVVTVKRGDEVVAKRSAIVSRGAHDELVITAPPLPPPVPVNPPPEVTPQHPTPPPPAKPQRSGFLASPWFWGATAAVIAGVAIGYYYTLYTPPTADPAHGTLGPGVVKVP